jgi:hypothetical protein
MLLCFRAIPNIYRQNRGRTPLAVVCSLGSVDFGIDVYNNDRSKRRAAKQRKAIFESMEDGGTRRPSRECQISKSLAEALFPSEDGKCCKERE